MRETLKELNIHHVTCSFYHPQANGVVERFHRTLHSIIAKRLDDHLSTWDVYLNQALAAIRFSISDSSQFSPYSLVFGRDPTLPIDNLLKPRRKYLGEEHHIIALEKSHESFMLVHQNLRKAKRRQAKYANKNIKEDHELKIGTPVFLKNNLRKNKLQSRWIPYYRIVKINGPANYVLRSQLDGSVIKAHSNNILRAKINEWSIPKTNDGRPLRKAAYVVPPLDSYSERESESELEQIPAKNKVRSRKSKRPANKRVHVGSSSDTDPDDDMPLAELRKRLRRKKLKLSDHTEQMISDNQEQMMDIDEIMLSQKVNKKGKSAVEPREPESTINKSDKIRNLLQAVADMI